jgi:hypothetical protein
MPGTPPVPHHRVTCITVEDAVHYKRFDLEIPDGVVTISGGFGSGETTLGLFLCYALDARFPAPLEKKLLAQIAARLGHGKITVGLCSQHGVKLTVSRTLRQAPVVKNAWRSTASCFGSMLTSSGSSRRPFAQPLAREHHLGRRLADERRRPGKRGPPARSRRPRGQTRRAHLVLATRAHAGHLVLGDDDRRIRGLGVASPPQRPGCMRSAAHEPPLRRYLSDSTGDGSFPEMPDASESLGTSSSGNGPGQLTSLAPGGLAGTGGLLKHMGAVP